MNKSICLLIFILFYGFSCSFKKSKGSEINKNNNESELLNFRENLKVSNSKTIDEITYKLYHISEKSLQELFKVTTDEYNNFTCFYFDIALENSSDIVSFPSLNYLTLNDKIQYLSFLIKDDFKILSNDKIFHCINSTYDRTYGKSASTRFFLVFNKIENNNILFQFDDNYFNNGLIQLKLNI